MKKEDEKRNPKIPDLQDLNEGFNILESFAHKVKYEDSLANAFQKLRDKYKNAGDRESLHKCQLELEFQSFVFVDGKVNPKFVLASPFPDLSIYSDSDLDYLKERHWTSKNPTLKARYAHLLWESKLKHIDFVKSAIDSYLDSTSQLLNFELEEPKKSRGHRIIDSLKSLWVLSTRVSYKEQETQELLIRIFNSYDYNNPASSSVRLFILDLSIEKWKTFGSILFPHIENVYTHQKDKTDLFGKMDWLLALGKVSNKSKLKSIDWKHQLADVYEQIADSFGKSNPASAEYISEALELYKSMKNTDKVADLERKYDEAKKSIRLGSYRQTIDLTESANSASRYAEELLKEHGAEVLNFLRDTPELIPNVNAIRTENEARLKKMPLQSDMPQSVLDHRGNTIEHFTTPEEIKRRWELHTYEFHLQCNKILLLRFIFLHGIKSGLFTIELFESYLTNETWLSQKRNIWSPAVETEESFLDLVLPALKYFITQTNEALANANYRPDFVLCCDSLAMKFESLLRDLCEQNKEATFFMKDDKSRRKVVNEQDINALLYSKTIKNLFSEDQLFYLRFVLIEKSGQNWRHKVAHGLSYKPEYSFNLMVLLVMCLLIVAKKKV
ncbi:DUF4209 domain-containing protein [Bdellovibrio bacteriovorus]|nr:DUF4209 domain-containing protein [Bdellovibrio bacteriovorus]